VHPAKLGVVGHGFGGSAAVFTAAGLGSRLRAAAALFPAVTSPPAEQPAAALTLPGLILRAPADSTALKSNADALAHAWPGAILRTVAKAEAGGLIEGRRLAKAVGLPGADKGTQKVTRALLTGYLLHVLTGDKEYRDFADPEVVLPKTVAPDPEAPQPSLEDKVVALLKG
jgi:pimeloyl-ACP methyl ester carboxylesterase